MPVEISSAPRVLQCWLEITSWGAACRCQERREMCIVCGVASSLRGLLAMLPWLIVPFIFVWAFSQFLSPEYRVEITSHRLACIGVLLTSLFWYELIVPRLASWRQRRADMLRERERLEAQRAARRRKEAIKHCRNCHLPYRDQNAPSTGRYMCSFCGHASKKPELHVPGEPRPVTSRVDTGLACWSDSDCWKALCEELEKQKVFHFAMRCGSGLLGGCVWVWRKLGKHDRLVECSLGRKLSGREVEDSQDRKEKARRKAEERRLARQDRERKEEEERRDREEIKRLVDERSRLRAEELEREAAAERDREAERKKQVEAMAMVRERERELSLAKEKEARSKQEAAEPVERESKSPELVRRRDRYLNRYQKPGFFSYNGNASSPSPRNKSSLRASLESKPSGAPAPVKEVTSSRLSWSSVLSGSYTKAINSPRSSTPGVSPQAPSAKSSPSSGARSSSNSKQLFPEPSSKLVDVSSPVPADPIYFPGTSPALLPPISAPHNTVNSEPESSPPLFTPYFPTPVLPALSSEAPPAHPVHLLSSTPLSADAPPFSSSIFPPSSSPFKSPVSLLPEDLVPASLELPLAFRDPFTGFLMSDPVTSSDGHSYDRHNIQAWLEHNDSSPITGEQLPSAPPADTVDRRLWSNHHLLSQINEYHERKARERAAVSWSSASVAAPGKHQIGGLYVDPLWSYGGEPGRVSNL